MFKRLLHDDAGATAIEYALIAVLVSMAMVVAFASLGLNLADIFNSVSSALKGDS